MRASGSSTLCQTFVVLSYGNNYFREHTPTLRVLEDGESCSSWFLQKPAVREWLCSYLIAIWSIHCIAHIAGDPRYDGYDRVSVHVSGLNVLYQIKLCSWIRLQYCIGIPKLWSSSPVSFRVPVCILPMADRWSQCDLPMVPSLSVLAHFASRILASW